MGKLRLFLTVPWLLTAWLAAAPAQAADSCYQRSSLLFFQQVVEIVSSERNATLGCWVLRLRLRGGRTSPPGHAMICGGNACSPHLDLRDGIYWWASSSANQNILSVSRLENGSCTDVSFCIVPKDSGETMLIDFIALYEEGYFLSPNTYRPRWSDGVADLSSLDGTKSHCQDGEPRGAVCL